MGFLFEPTSYNRTNTSGEGNLISNIIGVETVIVYLAKENDLLVRQAGILVLLLTSMISLILYHCSAKHFLQYWLSDLLAVNFTAGENQGRK